MDAETLYHRVVTEMIQNEKGLRIRQSPGWIPYAPGTYLAYHAQNRANFQPALEALTDHLRTFDDETAMRDWFKGFLLERPDEHTENASLLCQIIAFVGPRETFGSLRLS